MSRDIWSWGGGFFYFYLYEWGGDPNLAEIQFFGGLGGGGRVEGGRRWVCFWMHFFLQIFEHFSSTSIPPPTRSSHLWGGEGVGDGYVFGCIFFANFWTFFLYLYTSSHPLLPPVRGGGGRRWVCFWMHSFCKFLNIFPLPLYAPPPTWEKGVGGGGVWLGVGEGAVFLDSFWEFLEGVWRVWEGEGCLHTHTHTHYRLD